MHVSVPQCDVFGYFSIESEIVILIIPVDHYPKALQVGFSIQLCGMLSTSSLVDLAGGGHRPAWGGSGGEERKGGISAGQEGEAGRRLRDRAAPSSTLPGDGPGTHLTAEC